MWMISPCWLAGYSEGIGNSRAINESGVFICKALRYICRQECLIGEAGIKITFRLNLALTIFHKHFQIKPAALRYLCIERRNDKI